MKINLFGLLLLPAVYFGQVGINNTAPQGTLDITAKNATGTGTTPEGLIIPRVDRQKAQSMTGVQTSTLVYVNSVATGTQTGTAVNVDTVGYYYYNGTAWVKLNAGSGSSDNIYSADGTLAANRTVTQADKTLAFTGTAVNAFSVDGKTLSVDAANNRVGVGTQKPNGLMNIVADNAGSNAENDINIDGYGTSAYPGVFLGSAGGTEAAPVNLTNGTRIGGFGFKPWAGGAYRYESSGMQSYYRGDGTSNLTDLQFLTSGSLQMVIDQTGKVGIGTDTPQTTTHILNKGTGGTGVFASNTANMALRLENSTNGQSVIQHLLAKDASGATKQSIIGINPTFNGNGVFLISRDGSNDFVMDLGTGNIGMNTSTPTEKLDVNGNMRVRGAVDGSNITNFPKAVVMKEDGTLGTVKASNVTLQSYQLKIPPQNGNPDFSNHSVTTYDSDNWWVISKTSTSPTTNAPSRMNIVYEFQGTAFPNPNNIFPQLTAGNASGFPDVFVASFNSLQTVGGKTRLSVTILRVENLNATWGAEFLLNVLLAVKG
ncbi:autotransporter outer membrane beta-barrel domain-containing protein [Chryseobacterium kwangjuense]|uniref:Uncharacterized protein n=1 Tax=Chryseobacterium kwangjuense TaxID=267125 RepID=A0A135WF00_9FLAO|nr:hypothetical protein [Chryseobacterium kwangjuense]KXH83488.1 hypothetical protein AU378_13925 [Chryseobacterium kwangjuense]